MISSIANTIKIFLKNLHAKIGDLWWYSLLLFLVCRIGDLIQAFIGLYLVPRFVGIGELGAVLPLQQLCTLFAVPLLAFAVVFAKQINAYLTRGEIGKIKSFIKDTIAFCIAIFILCIVLALLVLPSFYKRLNIVNGLLTFLILSSAFISSLAQIFSNALQGFKKFNTLTFLTLITAPIRLITMLVAMPFRALSGYILGQTTPNATVSFFACISLWRDLKDVKADTSWRNDARDIFKYFVPVFCWTLSSALFTTFMMTIVRERLPEIESASYYMLTRFSEIAGFLGAAMTTVLFPLASESHERGKENTRALKHTLLGASLTTVVLVVLFALGAETLFSLLDTWRAFIPYLPLLPLMTIVCGTTSIITIIISYEIACKRFKKMFCTLALQLFGIALFFSLEKLTSLAAITLAHCALNCFILLFIFLIKNNNEN